MPLRCSLIALLTLAACSGDDSLDTDISSSQRAEGPALYSEHCVDCHGDDGLGTDFGPDLTERVPGLAPLDVASIVVVGSGRMRPVDELTNDEAVAVAFYVVETYGD